MAKRSRAKKLRLWAWYFDGMLPDWLGRKINVSQLRDRTRLR